jgi:hypothetical protein
MKEMQCPPPMFPRCLVLVVIIGCSRLDCTETTIRVIQIHVAYTPLAHGPEASISIHHSMFVLTASVGRLDPHCYLFRAWIIVNRCI